MLDDRVVMFADAGILPYLLIRHGKTSSSTTDSGLPSGSLLSHSEPGPGPILFATMARYFFGLVLCSESSCTTLRPITIFCNLRPSRNFISCFILS
jgi:hypothetical protein